MTTAEFLARHPEFGGLTPGIVSAVLAQAIHEVAADAYGTSYDEAHGLVAADKLWNSEHGQSMRLDDKGNERPSPYARLLRNLQRRKVPRIVVL